MVKPIGKTQVYEAVYDSMIDSIKTGGWPVGERIPGEIELSEAFQVSRNSVRTAIKVLVSDGILDCKPGVGTFVTDQALNEIHSRELLSMLQDTQYEAEVTEVRGILDKEIAYQAALMCTDEDIRKLEECLDKRVIIKHIWKIASQHHALQELHTSTVRNYNFPFRVLASYSQTCLNSIMILQLCTIEKGIYNNLSIIGFK